MHKKKLYNLVRQRDRASIVAWLARAPAEQRHVFRRMMEDMQATEEGLMDRLVYEVSDAYLHHLHVSLLLFCHHCGCQRQQGCHRRSVHTVIIVVIIIVVVVAVVAVIVAATIIHGDDCIAPEHTLQSIMHMTFRTLTPMAPKALWNLTKEIGATSAPVCSSVWTLPAPLPCPYLLRLPICSQTTAQQSRTA